MQMCPFCDKVYDESEYSRCPYCHPDIETIHIIGGGSKDDLLNQLTANLSGLPALNIPSGYYSDGMPIGISLMGKANAEPTLYRIANGIEAVLTDKGGQT